MCTLVGRRSECFSMCGVPGLEVSIALLHLVVQACLCFGLLLVMVEVDLAWLAHAMGVVVWACFCMVVHAGGASACACVVICM